MLLNTYCDQISSAQSYRIKRYPFFDVHKDMFDLIFFSDPLPSTGNEKPESLITLAVTRSKSGVENPSAIPSNPSNPSNPSKPSNPLLKHLCCRNVSLGSLGLSPSTVFILQVLLPNNFCRLFINHK